MTDFNLKPENKLSPETGRILIAEPFMEDSYFQRTVVLLCAHDEEGSFGFILNKYVDMELTDIMEMLPKMKNRIGMGGPVQNSNLYYIHTFGERLTGSLQIGDNLFVGGDFDVLKELLEAKAVDKSEIRFFVGYSGWDANQLSEELESESWYVSTADGLPLFDTKVSDFWGLALKKMGGEFANLAHFPSDPNLN